MSDIQFQEGNLEMGTEEAVSSDDASDKTSRSVSPKILKRIKINSTVLDWENISRHILLALAFLLPVVILPFTGAATGFSKSLLIYTFIIASAVFYLIHILQKGSFALSKNFIYLSLLAILTVSLVSSFFSSNINLSFIGNGNETATFLMLLVMSVGLFLVATLFKTERHIFTFLFVLGFSSIIVFFFQFFHSVVGITLSPWEIFSRKIDNLVGSWNELAIFFGFIALEAIVFFEFLGIGKKLRLFLIGLTVMSLLAMAIVNFTTAWIVFGVFLLVFLVYLYSSTRESRNFARLSLFIILIVVFFILAKSLMGDLVTSVNLESVEIRPSWSATLQVAKDTLGGGIKNMFLGSGPNTFLYDWLKYKPAEINKTFFWNVRFTSGIGLIPTLLVTTGILGVLTWLFLLVSLIYYGLKNIGYSGNNTMKSLMLGTFLGSAYLWVFSVIYSSNNFIFALSFLMTGLFLASVARSQKLKVKDYSFVNNTSWGFISALIIVLLMIVSVASFYLLFQKYWAANAFARGLAIFNTGDNLDGAQNNFLRAVRFDKQDRYYRSLSEAGLVRLSQILNQQMPAEELRAQFQNTLASTIEYAQIARDINPAEPFNWMLLGRIYESVVPLQINGARELALASYDEASKRDPNNPQAFLASARVEIQSGDIQSAQSFLALALAQKNDYTPALFLLAQTEAQLGNLETAIQQTEQARLFAPNDIGILFQLGLLYYQNDDFGKARPVFERTVALSPNYSNARYFLGLIYDKAGEKSEAIKQFEKIQELNPGHAEVEKILSNLRAGRGALQQISPPQPAPEKREELPIEEKSTIIEEESDS